MRSTPGATRVARSCSVCAAQGTQGPGKWRTEAAPFSCLTMLRRAPRRPCASQVSAQSTLRLARRPFTSAPASNVSPGISEKIGKNIYLRPGHPLNLVKRGIENYFFSKYRTPVLSALGSAPLMTRQSGAPLFESISGLDPKVSVQQNFDALLIPPEHPSRSPNDTFCTAHRRGHYSPLSVLSGDTVLRTHTSAHQNHLLQSGKRNFLVFGDVYRRDTIDATHYPVRSSRCGRFQYLLCQGVPPG